MRSSSHFCHLRTSPKQKLRKNKYGKKATGTSSSESVSSRVNVLKAPLAVVSRPERVPKDGRACGLWTRGVSQVAGAGLRPRPQPRTVPESRRVSALSGANEGPSRWPRMGSYVPTVARCERQRFTGDHATRPRRVPALLWMKPQHLELPSHSPPFAGPSHHDLSCDLFLGPPPAFPVALHGIYM